jgi:hypothetical protein
MRWVRKPLSTGLPATSCDNLNSYTVPERGGITKDGQGYHHLSPTPQPWSMTMHSPIPMYPSSAFMYKETTQVPPGTLTLQIDK